MLIERVQLSECARVGQNIECKKTEFCGRVSAALRFSGHCLKAALQYLLREPFERRSVSIIEAPQYLLLLDLIDLNAFTSTISYSGPYC